jgi:diguanylate cyclase (GGDEF)-like protein
MNEIQDPNRDVLTGLLNRRAFNEVFSKMLIQAKSKNHTTGGRGVVEAPLSVAILDIDLFMNINENFGHIGGDDALCALANMIRQTTGEEIITARYGGDEFALLLPELEREAAFLLMEQIRMTAANREIITQDDRVIHGLSISGGLATFPVDGRTEYELFRKASQALYRAKTGKKGQIRLAYEERMVPKTAHFTQTQLERLGKLAEEHSVNEADLLREAVDDLLTKYAVNDIES